MSTEKRVEDGMQVDVYVRNDKPVAIVLWKGSENVPFMALKDSGLYGLNRFALLSDDDVPAHDRRDTHLNVRVDLSVDGDRVSGVAVYEAGKSQPVVVVGEPVNDAGLTHLQQEALDTFRASKGRNWKSALRANWERASYPGMSVDHAAGLQQIRNSLGPEWLTKYRAPEPAAAAVQNEQPDDRVVVNGSGRAFAMMAAIEQREPDGWQKAYEVLERDGTHVAHFSFRDSAEHFVVKSSRFEFTSDVAGVSMLTASSAESVRKNLELEYTDNGPYAVKGHQEFAKAAWEVGREAKTLDEAKELAGVALAKLGLPEPTWRPSAGSVTPWEYTDVEVGGREKLVVGASSGGVVSVSGDPFTPGKRETNVTLARVVESLEPRIKSLRATVNEEAKSEVVGALMKSLEGWGETSRRHANALIGERIIVLDKHERAFSQVVSNGEPAVQLELPDPDLNGVSFMTPESAKKVCDHLSEMWPDDGPYVARDFQEYAKEKHAETLKLLNGIRERVYDFPNGYRSQAESMYGWLRHEGFTPDWDFGVRDGEARSGITIPVHQVPQLRIFQKTNPARWGNHPDVEKAMKDNQREMEEQSRINREKSAKLTPEQREWIEVIHYETHLHASQALELNERLHELSAQHFKLAHMDVESGLSKQQEYARETIEQQITELLDGVPNIKGPHFLYDPRGSTVGVKFESGRADSITGCYKVPLDPKRVKSLGNEEFWTAYPVSSEFAQQLKGSGVSIEQANEFAERLVELSTKHTKLADMETNGGWDRDRIADAKNALRDEIRGVVEEINGASQQAVISDVEFTFDSRFATVILNLESGRMNRISGGWSVPTDDDLAESLDEGELLDQYASEPENKNSGYVVLTINETGNAAFADLGRDREIARIVEEAADKIVGEHDDMEFTLRDVNGNRVGRVDVTNEVPTGDIPDGTVRLAIEMGDAAFADEPNVEVARIFREAASKIRDGEQVFVLHDTNGNLVGKYEYREEPSLAKDGVVDMNEALNSGRVYLAEDGYSGIADGEYRYVVTTPDFEPGYGQSEGEVWLVNAKGEIASGYDDPQPVRETMFRDLKRDEKSDLRAVVEGRVPFEEFERRFSDDDPELG